MQLGQISKLSLKPLKPWQSAVGTVFLVFLVGFLLLNILKKRPAKPIVIDDKYLTPAEAQALSHALTQLGDVEFFGADLKQIHQAASSLNWVENVDVYRDWYQGVLVTATSRRAIAKFGSYQMLDANGVIFEPVDSNQLLSKNLIRLQGDSTEARNIMQQLYRINMWFAPLNISVDDLVLTSRQTWIIRFNNGLRIIVDRDDTEQKLYNLPKILQKQYNNQMSLIQSIDLRYKNGFVIAWKNANSQVSTDSTPKK